MKTKRFISILLTAVFIFGCLPLTVFAANELIGVMDITLSAEDFPAPTAGETMQRDVSSIIEQYNALHCEVTYIQWTEYSSDQGFYPKWSIADSEELFDYNTTYYLNIILEPMEGYEFQVSSSDQKWWYTLNNEDCYQCHVSATQLQLYWKYPTTDKDTIKSLDLTLDEEAFPKPVAGESMYRDTTPLQAFVGDNYNSTYAYWIEDPKSAALVTYMDISQSERVFQSGTDYYLTICFDAVGDVTFSEEYLADYKLNGQSAYYINLASDSADLCWLWGSTEGEKPEPVNEVTITGVTAPVIGETADFSYTIPEDAKYSKYDEPEYRSYWVRSDTYPVNYDDIDYGEWFYSNEELVFEEGYTYTFIAEIVGNSAPLGSDTTATINGVDADVKIYYGYDNYTVTECLVYYTWNFGVELPMTFEKVEITGVTEPVIGETASFDFSLAEEYVACIDNVYWGISYYNTDDIDYWWNSADRYTSSSSSQLAFEEGYTYALIFEFYTYDVLLSDALTATINGVEADIDIYNDEYSQYVTVYMIWDFGGAEFNYVEDVDLRLDLNELGRPVNGETAYRDNYDELEDKLDRFYEIDYVYLAWKVTNNAGYIPGGDYYDIASDEIFPKNEKIYLYIDIYSIDGYAFSGEFVENYTLNGVAPTAFYPYEPNNYELYFDLDDIADNLPLTAIEGFDITLDESAMPTPDVGAEFTFDIDALKAEIADLTFELDFDYEHAYIGTFDGGYSFDNWTYISDTLNSYFFEEDTDYYIGFSFVPDSAYEFSAENLADYKLNGKSAVTCEANDYWYDVVFPYGSTKIQTIEGFDIALDESLFPGPVAGGSVVRDIDAINTAIGDLPFAYNPMFSTALIGTFNGEIDIDNWQTLAETDNIEAVFAENTTYYIFIALTPDKYNAFDLTYADNYLLDGKAPVWSEPYTNGSIKLCYEFGTTGEIPPAYTTGDINDDEEIDTIDYTILKRVVLGSMPLTEHISLAGDINKDNAVDTIDYTMLKRAVLGTYQIP